MEMVRTANDLVKQLDQPVLLGGFQLGVADDVDEKDIRYFELKLPVPLLLHRPIVAGRASCSRRFFWVRLRV